MNFDYYTVDKEITLFHSLTTGKIKQYCTGIQDMDYFGEDKVYPIYIDIEDGIRLERALDRERRQASPNYDELCRRFLADNKDFSLENLSNLDINKFYINEDLKQCINSIKKDILSLIQ